MKRCWRIGLGLTGVALLGGIGAAFFLHLWSDSSLHTAGQKIQLQPASSTEPAPPLQVRFQVQAMPSMKVPFHLTLYVKGQRGGEALTLLLPSEFRVLEGQATQTLPPPGEKSYTAVVWKVRVDKPGRYTVRAEIPGAADVTESVPVPTAWHWAEPVW